MSATRRRALVAALLSATLLVGCAGPAEPAFERSARSVAPADPVRFWAEQRVAELPLEQKVAGLLMLHLPGTDAERLHRFVERWQPGGMILMGDNVPARAGRLDRITAAMQRDQGRAPLLIAIDQEGGVVARIPEGRAGDPRRLRGQEPARTEAATRARGQRLAGLGVNVNFGIVADVSNDRGGFIHLRVLGTTPAAAAARVAAAVRGEAGSVASTLKHFPGHGAAPGDSHFSIPRTRITKQAWAGSHALPFVAGIEAGAPLVMTGHLAYTAVDALPASLSPTWHAVLREELGFDGLIVTDDMLMLQRSGVGAYRDGVRNARRALAAGATMVLFVLGGSAGSSEGLTPQRLIDGLVAEVAAGRLSEAELDERLVRLLAYRRGLAEAPLRS